VRASAVLLSLALLSTNHEAIGSGIPLGELVGRADAGGWSFEKLRSSLPAPDVVQDQDLEIHDWTEHAYDGGALRLYVSRRGDRLIALLADTRRSPFRDAPDVGSAGRHFTHAESSFVVIMPNLPVERVEFETLRARAWDPTEAENRLGPASYRRHVHGGGWLFWEWVGEGLSLVAPGPGEPFRLWDWTLPSEFYEVVPDKPPAATAVPYETYLSGLHERHRKFAALLVRERQQVEAALAAGTVSPDGRFVVAPVCLGGTYNTAQTAVMERGKAERLFPAGYFTERDDYVWLDDRTVLWRVDDAVSVKFSTLDAITGRRELVLTLPRSPRKPAFGVSGPRSFWWSGADGERHHVVLEDGPQARGSADSRRADSSASAFRLRSCLRIITQSPKGMSQRQAGRSSVA
jgi:hypothetical protein